MNLKSNTVVFQVFHIFCKKMISVTFTRLKVHFQDSYQHRWARVFGQGGGGHRGVSEKKFSGRLRRPKNFSPAPPPGGEKFFSVGGLFSRPGGDFAQKSKKMASPGGQNFFSPGCFAPRGAPPPLFFSRRVSGKFSA